MLGRQPMLFSVVNLETLVPQNHLLRRVDQLPRSLRMQPIPSISEKPSIPDSCSWAWLRSEPIITKVPPFVLPGARAVRWSSNTSNSSVFNYRFIHVRNV
jgi:hypothetical protein